MKKTLSNNDYKKYMEIVDEYINEGGAFDEEMILDFVKTLIQLNKKEEAMIILRNLSKITNSDYARTRIARYMYFCFYPREAAKVLLSKTKLKHTDHYDLAKMYMLMGDLASAKKTLKLGIKYTISDSEYEKYQDRLREIENHSIYNAFVETEYDCFIANGGILEPGHIVFFKRGLELKNEIDLSDSEITRKRPYLIWKIDGDTIYTFPITKTPVYTSRCFLSVKDYPNSKGNRYIKKSIGVSNVQNILSIKDKVSSSMVLEIMKDIYEDSFKYATTNERRERIDFLRYYIGPIDLHDIIEYYDVTTRGIKYLFVIEIYEDGYKTLEIDENSNKLKMVVSFISDSDPSIYKVKKLDIEEKKIFIEQGKTLRKVKN